MSTIPRLTRKRREYVVAALETKTITAALEELGLARRAYYTWREADPVFANDCDVARMRRIENIEARLNDLMENGALEHTEVKATRLVDGKEIEYTKERSATRKWYPSTMLRVLERRHPDYNGRRIDGGDVEINLPAQGMLDIRKLSTGEQREFKRLLIKCGAVLSDAG